MGTAVETVKNISDFTIAANNFNQTYKNYRAGIASSQDVVNAASDFVGSVASFGTSIASNAGVANVLGIPSSIASFNKNVATFNDSGVNGVIPNQTARDLAGWAIIGDVAKITAGISGAAIIVNPASAPVLLPVITGAGVACAAALAGCGAGEAAEVGDCGSLLALFVSFINA